MIDYRTISRLELDPIDPHNVPYNTAPDSSPPTRGSNLQKEVAKELHVDACWIADRHRSSAGRPGLRC